MRPRSRTGRDKFSIISRTECRNPSEILARGRVRTSMGFNKMPWRMSLHNNRKGTLHTEFEHQGWLTLGVHVPALPHACHFYFYIDGYGGCETGRRRAGAALAEGRLEKGVLPSSPPSILHDPMQRDCSIHITDLRTWTFSAYRDKSAILHA